MVFSVFRHFFATLVLLAANPGFADGTIPICFEKTLKQVVHPQPKTTSWVVRKEFAPFTFEGNTIQLQSLKFNVGTQGLEEVPHLLEEITNPLRDKKEILEKLSQIYGIKLDSYLSSGGMKAIFTSPEYPGKVIKIFNNATMDAHDLADTMMREIATYHLMTRLDFTMAKTDFPEEFLKKGMIIQNKIEGRALGDILSDMAELSVDDKKHRRKAIILMALHKKFNIPILEWAKDTLPTIATHIAKNDPKKIVLYGIDVYDWKSTTNIRCTSGNCFFVDW